VMQMPARTLPVPHPRPGASRAAARMRNRVPAPGTAA
jgi:hypothetical protein